MYKPLVNLLVARISATEFIFAMVITLALAFIGGQAYNNHERTLLNTRSLRGDIAVGHRECLDIETLKTIQRRDAKEAYQKFPQTLKLLNLKDSVELEIARRDALNKVLTEAKAKSC